jgi:hypothetical protein
MRKKRKRTSIRKKIEDREYREDRGREGLNRVIFPVLGVSTPKQ